MVQNGVRVSTFSDSTSPLRLFTYLAHMRNARVPTRSKTQLGTDGPARRSQACRIARCLAIVCCIGCGPSAWPGGIHAVLAASERGVRVVEVPPDSPAARAGLLADDVLLAVDGRPVTGMSARAIHELLTGEVGTTVVLQVERQSEKLEIPIERAPYTGR
jgi:membrane-associated protease RseP (regulator of RpoE activity)